MNKIILALVALILCTNNANAYSSKKLTVIVPRNNLSKTEYKSLESFARSLGKSIKANWFPQEYQRSLRTVVRLEQGADYKQISVSESSGDDAFDASGVKAMERSTEKNTNGTTTNLEYVFEYKYRTMPVSASMFGWPAKVGVGYLSKKAGLNTYVTIPIL